MSYIRDNLMPNEKVLFTARVSQAVFLPAIVTFIATIVFAIYALITVNQKHETPDITGWFMLLVSGMFFLMTLKIGFQALIIILTTEFAVTNRRVIAKTGFIHRRTLEMLLSKIESVAVYQHILGKFFNFGSVTVVGTGGTKEKFMAIVEPFAVRKKINQIIENNTQSNFSNHQQTGG